MTRPEAPPRAPTTSDAVYALPVIAAYAIRACFPARRRFLLLLPCLASALLGLLGPLSSDLSDADGFARVAVNVLFSLVLPIACLVIGDAVVGADVRAGTFVFTWASPIPLWAIVVGRWLGGSAVAIGSLVPAFVVAALVAGVPEAADEVALAVATGAVAYVALFVLVGCSTRRAAVWSLAVVFLGERLLGSALTGIAQVSPGWEARSVFTGLFDVQEDLVRGGIPQGGGAVFRLALITAVCLVAAVWRLRRLRLTGPSDG